MVSRLEGPRGGGTSGTWPARRRTAGACISASSRCRRGPAWPGPLRSTLDDGPERLPRERPPVAVEKQRAGIAALEESGAGRRRVALHPPERLGADRHQALAAALAGRSHIARCDIEVLEPERKALRGPEPGGVEELQHGAVPETFGGGEIRRLDERGRVLDRERARQPARWSGRFEMLGRVTAYLARGHEKVVEGPDGGEVPRRAPGAQTAAPQIGQVARHLAHAGSRHGSSLALEICREAGE